MAPLWGAHQSAQSHMPNPTAEAQDGEGQRQHLFTPEELPEPSAQAAFRCDIWVKSVVAGLVVVSPAMALGYTKDMGSFPENFEEWDKDVLYQVCIPGLLVYIITSAVVSRLTTVIGFSMLREKGPGVSIKESVRTNMTNNGIVLALFETMLLGMWQTDGQEGGSPRNAMWYRLFLLFGIEACTRGVVMVSIFLVFLEPLDDSGSKQFAVDNMLYLGEPTACIGLTMVYFLQSIIVWVFHVDGKFVGALGFLLFAYCVIRIMVVAAYMLIWRNPGVTDEIRQARSSKFQLAQAQDGTRMGQRHGKKSSENLGSAQQGPADST